ncbi:hypothetical protein R6Q57_024210 [Mikania cordata]
MNQAHSLGHNDMMQSNLITYELSWPMYKSRIYGVHDEAKDKTFELEMSWVCDESNRQHQKVPEALLEEAKAAAKLNQHWKKWMLINPSCLTQIWFRICTQQPMQAARLEEKSTQEMYDTTQLLSTQAFEAVPTHTCLTADDVLQLPGQPPVTFRQFAGYIPVDDRFLFYYFVEAESDPSSKPLVLWLNGGPGCSSVGEGAFVEHGPFKPKGDVLVNNDFSWNKEANMLYLETPAGVGFSYSLDESFYSSVNDALTAGDNLVFLEKWLKKYPEYKNRDFYITGESYAGHYVPQLASLIVHSKAKINLKGIGIGNPLLEFDNDFNSRGEYLWSHGIISDDTYDMFNKVCNYSTIRRQDNFNAITPTCAHVANQASKEIGEFVNPYDVALDMCLSNVFSQSQVLDRNPDTEAKVDICVEDETTKYLNRKDVQTALNARLVNANEWAPCSKIVKYDMTDMEESMTPVLASLLKSGIRVFIFR